MIAEMPRPTLPHLHRQITRHGKIVWYVRVGHGTRLRLRAPYGTPEFDAEYQAALEGRPVAMPSRAAPGSLSWLYERYRETATWAQLAPATRRQRENIFAQVMKVSGHKPYRLVTAAAIEAGAARRAATPFQAKHFIHAMRGLFRWARQAQHVRADPTAGIRVPRPGKKSEGFPAWTPEDIAAYEARWPIGTKERVWLDVLLYTGLRRGDAVRVGRQHIREGILTIRTEKSGGAVVVAIPVLPVLAATLAAGPTGELALICGDRGAPLTKESFGNLFRDACRKAGVKKSAHGIRKAAATRAAENGATVAELEAIFGWSGGGMASLYTRSADRARLARGAITKIARTADEQFSPSPGGKVRDAR